MGERRDVIDFLKTPEIKTFIREHLNTETNQLLLNPPSEIAPYVAEVASQIQSRQKARKKLDSWAQNFDLILPPPLSVEQASSEETAAYKKSILQGKHLIDLTGGMGVDTLALSEQFEQTTFVERQPILTEVFSHNCNAMGKEIAIVCLSAESFLETLPNGRSYTFYIDPARRDEAKNKVFNLEDCTPNIIKMEPQLRKKGEQVLVKLSPFLDIKFILKRIKNIKEIHVVSVKNECKEVLILIDYSFEGEPEIKTINIGSTSQSYTFLYSKEAMSQALYHNVKKFLLEPNASILKAGAFNQIAVDFGVEKIHANTHLYTSDQLVSNWPGKIFEIVERNVDRRIISKYAADGYINVITRNYPVKPIDLKKKFKVQDGGVFFLMGFTDCNEKKHLTIAQKVNGIND